MRLYFPSKDSAFFEATIGGVRFVAGARGDPYVTDGEHSIQLGHAAKVLYLTSGADHRFRGPGWYVCKYGRKEIKFALPMFNDDEARDFADTFGMEYGDCFDGRSFSESPAGAALASFFEQHPRLLSRCPCNYLSRDDLRGAVAA